MEQSRYSPNDFNSFDKIQSFAVFVNTFEGVLVGHQPTAPFWRSGIRPSEAAQEISYLTGCLHGEHGSRPYLSAATSSEGADVLTLLFMTAIAKPRDAHLAHLVHNGGCA